MVFQFNNAAFTPQVYAFSPVLLHPNDAHEHHIGHMLLTVMPLSYTIGAVLSLAWSKGERVQGLGVPAPNARRRAIRFKSSPKTAPGFPLLSLTRNTGSDPSGVVSEWGVFSYTLRPLQGRNRAGERSADGCDPFGVARCGAMPDPEGVTAIRTTSGSWIRP